MYKTADFKVLYLCTVMMIYYFRWGVECVSVSDKYCLTTDTKQLTIWDHQGITLNR